jgi:AbrB family looped-hinge helix DNA binding protein
MKARVSEKGQVTIPKPLRERLGIRVGDVLDFSDDQGRLVAEKVQLEDPVEAVRGILRDRFRDLGFDSTEAIDAMRGQGRLPRP